MGMFIGASIAAVAGLVIGFVAGLIAYQRSRRWCTACGATLQCLVCQPPPAKRTSAAVQSRRQP